MARENKIYRIPLNNENSPAINDEEDPSTFLQLPQVGDSSRNVSINNAAYGKIGVIELPQATTAQGEQLIPSDITYVGFIASYLGPIINKEAGRLYITHKNSGDVRICDASEVDPQKNGHSWLNFGFISQILDIIVENGNPINKISSKHKELRNANSPCTNLERNPELSSDPTLVHSGLERFVYLLDSDHKLKIINNDYYTQWHIDHPHDRLITYTPLPITISANEFVSFYSRESTDYYQRSQLEARFTASVAIVDGTSLKYFKESSICLDDQIEGCEGEKALSESDIITSETEFPASDLRKILLLGDRLFYIYRENDFIKMQAKELNFP